MYQKKHLLIALALIFGVIAFFTYLSTRSNMKSSNYWNANIKFSENHTLFFQIETISTEESDDFEAIAIINGDEKIQLTSQGFDENAKKFIWTFPFQSEIRLNSKNDFTGVFVKTENNESYPFEITHKTKSRKKINRFPNSVFSSTPNENEVLLSDRFSLKLKSSSLNPKAGIAEFQRDPKTNEYTGSILTQTGDYRYLAGTRMGNQLYISTFDGVHAYSFLIKIKENGHIEGIHFSGESYSEPFTGVPDSTIMLDDPYKITKIINDKSKLDIILPEYKSGELVRVPIGEGKVTLLQVMGSWCPNCLDESSFFNELSDFDNLNIYALAFEKNKDRLKSLNSIKRIESYLDLKYPILFAGKAQKSEVERLLPISNFISYPTYLLFDKKGDLVEIHAGFSGPATKGYSKFTSEFRSKIQSLISHSHGQ